MPEITTDEDVLRTHSKPVNDLEVSNIIEQLSISIPNQALGLSAPQIGIHKRAFITNLSIGSYIFINPLITWKSVDRVPSMEACLSLPGISRYVERYSSVSVSCSKIINMKDGSLTADPEPMRVRGQDAFIIQHEYDHLDGILIIDLPQIKTAEEKATERNNKRQERIAKKRMEKSNKVTPPPKQPKTSIKGIAKKKRMDKKAKRRQRTSKRREKIRVEIQEKFRAEQEGLFEQPNTSPELTKNEE